MSEIEITWKLQLLSNMMKMSIVKLKGTCSSTWIMLRVQLEFSLGITM